LYSGTGAQALRLSSNPVSETLKALIRDAYGTPDVLEVRDIAQPVPKADEVLVRVDAGALEPVIDGSYTLDNAREAFRRFGAGQHLGKIVVSIE
jgi:NADPH:quinone reductase-like Zn-dependent oxidoreductase